MESLDEKVLRRELASAVADDNRRKAVDEMKKRSILTARSYDEFRQLVACAEDGQKPLSSKEMEFLGKPSRASSSSSSSQSRATLGWSNRSKDLLQRAKQQHLNKHQPTRTEGKEGEGGKVSVPTTLREFEKFWRRTDLSEKVKFDTLVAANPSVIFNVELHDLGGILRFVSQCIKEQVGEESKAKMFLKQLCAVERFSIEASMLCASEKEAFTHLNHVFSLLL